MNSSYFSEIFEFAEMLEINHKKEMAYCNGVRFRKDFVGQHGAELFQLFQN